jgi:hypothetical protein
MLFFNREQIHAILFSPSPAGTPPPLHHTVHGNYCLAGKYKKAGRIKRNFINSMNRDFSAR